MRCLRPCLSVVVMLLAVVAGCEDQEPPLAFNTDLGENGARLLPSSLAYHRARDASITSGNQRATLIKLDEYDPNNDPADGGAMNGGATPQTPKLTEATDGIGGAMSQVGKAFVGNLLGGNQADTSGAGDSGQSTSTPPGEVTGDAAGASGGLAETDDEAIRALIERYNAARTQRMFADLAVLSTQETRPTASRYYTLIGELNASFGVLVNSFEKIQSGAQADFEQRISAAIKPMTVNVIGSSGEDVAEAVTETHGRVNFKREAGAWYMVDPLVPSEENWPDVESKLTDAIDALDDKDDALASGESVPASEINAALSRAVALLAGQETVD